MNVQGKILDIKTSIVGKKVTGDNDEIGFQVEQMLKQEGWPVQSGTGPDIQLWGIEIKTRNIFATSMQTVGRITEKALKITPYDRSSIKQKIQRQIRVYHNGLYIVDAQYYDFSQEYIQENLREAYEIGIQKVIEGCNTDWIPGKKNSWANFEADKHATSKQYQFRISEKCYKKLEAMSRLTFDNLFKVV